MKNGDAAQYSTTNDPDKLSTREYAKTETGKNPHLAVTTHQ